LFDCGVLESESLRTGRDGESEWRFNLAEMRAVLRQDRVIFVVERVVDGACDCLIRVTLGSSSM
jgi:hypothetical protein